MNNNHVLLIGIGQRYDDSKAIEVTAKDATRLASEFSHRYRYNSDNVIPLVSEQASRAKVMHQLDTLIAKTKEKQADLVVIFFSGHGVKKNGQFFLISRDAEKENLKYTAIEGNVFIQTINEINAKAVLILLNCCYSGAIQGDGYESADIPFDKNSFIQKPNRAIITACSGSEKAFTSTPLSIFTYALVSGLAGECLKNKGKKKVGLFDLAMYIRETVVALSKNKQHPELEVLEHSSATNFDIVDYTTGIPPFEKEERGGIYDALGNELKFPHTIEEDTDYRNRFKWLGSMKNTVIDSNIEADNLHIGDTTIGQVYQQGDNPEIKNAVIGSTIKAKNVSIGDNVINVRGNDSNVIFNNPNSTITINRGGK